MTRNEETGRGQYNCSGYSNPEMDAIVEASNTETDPVKRSEDAERR